jgi:putative endopeptidase
MLPFDCRAQARDTMTDGARPAALACALALAGALAAVACAPPAPPAAQSAEPATVRVGFDPADLDARVRPQDDFYRFVNGHWLDATALPPDRPSYGQIQRVQDRTEEQLRQLLTMEGTVGSSADAGSRKLHDFYASFMDETRVNQLGMAPLQPELARIDALRTRDDVIAWMGASLAGRIDGPVRDFVDADPADPERHQLFLWQSGLGLPDRDYYLLDTEEMVRTRREYLAHVARMFDQAGWPDGDAAAQVVFGIEKALAERQWSAVQNRDRDRLFRNRYTLEAARLLAPGLDWHRLFQAAGIAAPAEFIVAQPDYFRALGEVVASAPVANWQQYFRFRLLEAYAPALGDALQAEDFAFRGRTLQGQKEIRARWKRGVALVSENAPELLGQAYVARWFPPAAKARADTMVRELVAAYRDSIQAATWMSDATRAEALAKLERMRTKIGHPSRWRDYAALEVRADDLAGNLRRARAFDHAWEAGQLGQPVDHEQWDMAPQEVNAYNQPLRNEIVFPAALLQPPFFDVAADDAANYGSIGAIIGHEISHSFDDQGRKFDAQGRLRDWWTAADAERYQREVAKLVAEYGAFRPLRDAAINGELTLGENIADLAGLIVAHRAYRHSLAGREPPTMAGYTGDQRFFIAYAVAWRARASDEFLRKLLLTNPHSPPEYRVRGVLPHLPEFVTAFGVKEGDGMFLAPAARVHLW